MPPKNPIIKIVLFGDKKVGKTALIRRYINGKYTDAYQPTVDPDFSSKELAQANLQIWDTSNAYSFGNSFYLGAHVLVFVVDPTKSESLKVAKKLKKEISPEDFEKAGKILVVTKTELPANEQKVNDKALAELAKKLDCQGYYKTSAKEAGDNTTIDEFFTAAAKLGLKKLQQTASSSETIVTLDDYFDENSEQVLPPPTCGTKIAECLRHLFCCFRKPAPKPQSYHPLTHETPSQNL